MPIYKCFENGLSNAKMGGSLRKSAYPLQRTMDFEADKRIGMTLGNRSG